MEKYDYFKSVKEDVKKCLDDWFDFKNVEDYSDIDEVVDDVYNDFLNSDSITGHGSGSYTFSSWKAEENLCHNKDLLKEALVRFGGDYHYYVDCSEVCDVIIRCYVLGQVIDEIVKEYVAEHFTEFEF